MKLSCTEPNYAATVMRIHNTIKLDGLDNLVGIPAFGFMALVPKDYQVGELGVLFTAETKLSHEFCHNNNLYRDSTLNKDTEKTGYLDENRRVKSLRLRGNISTALFLPLLSLEYLGVNPEDFKEGDTFNEVNGERICEKYVIQVPQSRSKNKIKGQTRKRLVDENVFKQHIETEHFLRNLKKFNDDDLVIVTEKIHSTSGRFGNIQVDRNLSWIERLLKKFGVKIQEKEYKTISGSRRVVKEDGSEQSFYKNDVWHQELEKIRHIIPKDVVLYGEIVGWDGDSPLQKDYTYQMPKGTTKMYVYRIATVNEDGFMIDWGWEQIKDFCKSTGIKHVPEIFFGYFKDFDYTKYENKKFREELGLSQCLPLDEGAPCSEGLVIRKVDGNQIPYLAKYKSPEFYIHEGVQISSGQIDMETAESL